MGRMGCVPPQGGVISLAQFHSTNPLPASRGARRPPVLGRKWVVREVVLPSERIQLRVCRKRPEFNLQGAKGLGLAFSSLRSRTKSCIPSSWLCPPWVESQLLRQHH